MANIWNRSAVSPNPTASRASAHTDNARPLSASDLNSFGRQFAVPPSRFARAIPEVGYANIINQLLRKAAKEGFEFNLMVAGGSSLGKTTFLNTLFMAELDTVGATPYQSGPSNTQGTVVTEKKVRLVEKGVTLTLKIVETPGFGDAVDNRQCLDSVAAYLSEQYWKYYSEERAIERKSPIPDGRIHCCLYFISPNGRGLKPLDLEFMKKFYDRVNIIPVLAKADTLTQKDCAALKEAIAGQIVDAGIKLYTFPNGGPAMGVPFAVVGGDSNREIDGKMVRGRDYPWGFVQVDNPDHNDFVLLRDLLVRQHMIDLISVTSIVHYGNFRILINGLELLEQIKKEDDDRNQVFEAKVASKQDQYNQKKMQVESEIANMRSTLEEKRRKLNEKRRQLQDAKAAFNDGVDDGNSLTPNYGQNGHGASFSSNNKKSKSSGSLGSVFRSYKSPTDK